MPAETVAAKNRLEIVSKRWFLIQLLRRAGLRVPSAVEGATRSRP
jgi:hypothetical protein